MAPLFLLAAFVASAASASIDSYIVGGSDASLSAYPFQAVLLNNGALSCGAVVVSRTKVITAAHCVAGVSTGSLSVQCNRGSGTESNSASVASVQIADGYSSATSSTGPQNNVAAVTLSSPLNFNDNCGSASFETDASADYTGQTVVITGYGVTQSGGSKSQTLKKASMSGVSSSACYRAWGEIDNSSEFCLESDSGASACNGDSGGPAVFGSKVVGIASYGNSGCSTDSRPNVYTRVAAFAELIAA